MILSFAVLIPARELFNRVLVKRVANNRFTEYLKRKSDAIVYKVVIVRFLLEGCIELGLTAMISCIVLFNSAGEASPVADSETGRLLRESRWTNAEVVSNTCAVVTLIGLLASPFYLFRAARLYFKK